jgi:hypothetical protein
MMNKQLLNPASVGHIGKTSHRQTTECALCWCRLGSLLNFRRLVCKSREKIVLKSLECSLSLSGGEKMSRSAIGAKGVTNISSPIAL